MGPGHVIPFERSQTHGKIEGLYITVSLLPLTGIKAKLLAGTAGPADSPPQTTKPFNFPPCLVLLCTH